MSRIEVFEVEAGFGAVEPVSEAAVAPACGWGSCCIYYFGLTEALESAAAHSSDKDNSGSASAGYGDLVGSGAGAETGSPGSLSPVRLARLSPLCPPIDACEIRF